MQTISTKSENSGERSPTIFVGACQFLENLYIVDTDPFTDALNIYT